VALVESASNLVDGASRVPGLRLRRLAERWRWYHFYFVLAVFDLVVILASIGLYHQSLRSYQRSLAALTTLGAKQSWVTDLRAAVVELNAPGNDVFESRQLVVERKRFDDLRARVQRLLEARPLPAFALPDFEGKLAEMVDVEESIFSLFDALLSADGNPEDEKALFNRASARMATMDRAQADALKALGDVEQSLRSEQQGLLVNYEHSLRRNIVAQRYFFVTVAVALVGMFLFGRTLQRANEQMVADRRRILEERQAHLMAIGEVCATVAHGLSNPLAGIYAAAQLARERVGEGPLSEILEDIESESRRLGDRARRLLDFSRPLQPHLAAVDVRGLFEGVVRGLQSSHKNVHYAVDVVESLRLHADVDMLGEALHELGVNAIRAMGGEGTLRFEARRTDAMASIRVVDQARGVPAAIRPRLFELFFSTRPGGTGMGLATVRKLIQANGGTIVLESAGNEGTIFRVELPLAS
jgi:signal transduction histidine kinase